MKVCLDEDIAPEVAVILRSLRVDAISMHESGRQGPSDREQLELAAAEGRCLVTRNRNDFIILTREFFEKGLPHAGALVFPWTIPPDDFRLVAKESRPMQNARAFPQPNLFDFV